MELLLGVAYSFQENVSGPEREGNRRKCQNIPVPEGSNFRVGYKSENEGKSSGCGEEGLTTRISFSKHEEGHQCRRG